jgi:hypothetical protein
MGCNASKDEDASTHANPLPPQLDPNQKVFLVSERGKQKQSIKWPAPMGYQIERVDFVTYVILANGGNIRQSDIMRAGMEVHDSSNRSENQHSQSNASVVCWFLAVVGRRGGQEERRGDPPKGCRGQDMGCNASKVDPADNYTAVPELGPSQHEYQVSERGEQKQSIEWPAPPGYQIDRVDYVTYVRLTKGGNVRQDDIIRAGVGANDPSNTAESNH